MGSKTISVSDEAYARLKSLKKHGESFSDVINRLTKRRRLSELAGALDGKDGEVLEETIASLRARSRERIEAIREELEV
ncbi:MAG: antitoxin VapB family protein [Candidatus Thorarchaeota archaeon]